MALLLRAALSRHVEIELPCLHRVEIKLRALTAGGAVTGHKAIGSPRHAA